MSTAWFLAFVKDGWGQYGLHGRIWQTVKTQRLRREKHNFTGAGVGGRSPLRFMDDV